MVLGQGPLLGRILKILNNQTALFEMRLRDVWGMRNYAWVWVVSPADAAVAM